MCQGNQWLATSIAVNDALMPVFELPDFQTLPHPNLPSMFILVENAP